MTPVAMFLQVSFSRISLALMWKSIRGTCSTTIPSMFPLWLDPNSQSVSCCCFSFKKEKMPHNKFVRILKIVVKPYWQFNVRNVISHSTKRSNPVHWRFCAELTRQIGHRSVVRRYEGADIKKEIVCSWEIGRLLM